MLTYGDGLSNIDLNDLISFHHSHGKLMTVSAVDLLPGLRITIIRFKCYQLY